MSIWTLVDWEPFHPVRHWHPLGWLNEAQAYYWRLRKALGWKPAPYDGPPNFTPSLIGLETILTQRVRERLASPPVFPRTPSETPLNFIVEENEAITADGQDGPGAWASRDQILRTPSERLSPQPADSPDDPT